MRLNLLLGRISDYLPNLHGSSKSLADLQAGQTIIDQIKLGQDTNRPQPIRINFLSDFDRRRVVHPGPGGGIQRGPMNMIALSLVM